MLVVAGAAGVELVSHGVLPGKQELDQLDGACSVASPPLRTSGVGHSESGSFYSQARRRTVGYTIAWPPGAAPGTPLPLIVMLHGYGGNHTNALSGMRRGKPWRSSVDGQPLPPMAMVTVDGGGGYWNPHPGDDPMAMVISELIPMCQRMHLGRSPQKIGTMGISMGGYGALLLAEKYPDADPRRRRHQSRHLDQLRRGAGGQPWRLRVSGRLRRRRRGHAHWRALADTPVRVASGNDDPFHPGVLALAHVAAADRRRSCCRQGCHTGPFFTAQEPPSLQFLARNLTAS